MVKEGNIEMQNKEQEIIEVKRETLKPTVEIKKSESKQELGKFQI